MGRRFVSVWFRYLTIDRQAICQPEFRSIPFVFAAPVHGRMMITAANPVAEKEGVKQGMALADAKAIVPGLEMLDEKPGLELRLLATLGEWMIRFAPIVALDLPDGLILDASGCTHLWGDENAYVADIISRLKSRGYHVRAAMADTVGVSRAMARFGNARIIAINGHIAALQDLPPAALRLEQAVLERLHKLGLRTIGSFMTMPRPVLRRRFGLDVLVKLNQALGLEDEPLSPIVPVVLYEERLPCLEPIKTAVGIEIAIHRLLESLCARLAKDGQGIRMAELLCYRIDGYIEQVSIGTNRSSNNPPHLFKLFQLKISTIKPALGIELFVLKATKVENAPIIQEKMWSDGPGLDDLALTELLDRLAGKLGADKIHRYLPAEHYWPEHSIKPASFLNQEKEMEWPIDKPRPIRLLNKPERIEVSAPIPDYPPMNFRYKGKLHMVQKVDGPERIEQEWWMAEGRHRDYYYVEDKDGQRYWLFRSGHYREEKSEWFLHGFFA